MDVTYVHCFKSVCSYKHKLSRIESLVILYWGIINKLYIALLECLTLLKIEVIEYGKMGFRCGT